MSINWVMLSPNNDEFVPLQHEHKLWSSPPRTSIQIQSLNKFPSREPFQLSSGSGRIFLTNQRIIYLPESPLPALQSFAAPLLKIHDSRVTTPFFGPNAWIALVQPVASGGIPSQHSAVEVKLTFKEGGAYDFHTKFVQVKERLSQVADVAAESGQTAIGSSSAGANLGRVHLEQLPAYEEGLSANHDSSHLAAPPPAQPPAQPVAQPGHTPSTRTQTQQHPDEPPPGYDEL